MMNIPIYCAMDTAAIREIKPYLEKEIVKELKSVGGNKKRVVKPSFLCNFQTQVKTMKKQATSCVMILIIALSLAMAGCVDDEAANKPSATNGDTINDTTATLNENATDLNDSAVEELINESEVETIPELEPKPEVETTPMVSKDLNITVVMNETVNQSGLSVTCTMVKNEHHYSEGTDWRPEVDVRSIKLYVTINATGDYEIETGLKDWWIMDERGRKYQTTAHTDVKPMKPMHKLSNGDTVDAYLLFDLSGNVTDFVVQYNLSNVISSDCEVISWVVGDASPPLVPECRDGFVRYPIMATGGCYHTSNRTWVNDDLTFCSNGDVKFAGTHRNGLGMWEIVESDGTCNVYNVTFRGQVYTVNINVRGGWRSNGCGAGIWNEI